MKSKYHLSASQSIPMAYKLSELDVKTESSSQTPICAPDTYDMF